MREYQRGWRERNLPRVRSEARARYFADRDRIRDRQRWTHLLRKYGVTKERYEQMFAEQDGVCAVCGQPPKGRMSLAVDHCHETGFIRGLLCARCNPLVERMEKYITKARARFIAEHEKLQAAESGGLDVGVSR